jgi:predicted metalloprotease
MRWQDFRRSDNVEESTGGGSSGIGGIHLGIGGVIIVIVISLLLGKNPLDILALLTDGGAPTQTQTTPLPSGQPGAASPGDEQKEFVARVLGDTEDVWGAAFKQNGGRYQPPKLMLFHGGVESACGLASAATGPFYCPGDERVYLDLGFSGSVPSFRRTGRLRPRLRDRARSRPPRAESDGVDGASAAEGRASVGRHA